MKCCSNIANVANGNNKNNNSNNIGSNNINWSALLPKDKQTICSLIRSGSQAAGVARGELLPLPLPLALAPLAVGVKIVCDLSKLCNYSAYARLSKLNTHKLTAATAAAGESALPCFGFTVRRLIDFYLCCACVCSCSISTTWRMRNMATCPTTHTRTH